MPTFKWFACFVLVATADSGLSAETNCPGNVASVPYRVVNRHQMIVPVSINHSGPYDFLLDTGTQMTMLDPSLAAELRLNTEGKADVVSVGVRGSASFTRLDLIEVGSHSVSKPRVLVYDLRNLPVSDLHVQGVLGEDFLEHFDMLVDNAHKLLCLDDTGALHSAVKGVHIPLLTDASRSHGESVSAPLMVLTRLSDGLRPVVLELDSGSNAPVLFNANEYVDLGLMRRAEFVGGGANGARCYYSALRAQKIRFGRVEIADVTFLNVNENSMGAAFDGLLPFAVFRRVFIEHADHFVVLDAW